MGAFSTIYCYIARRLWLIIGLALASVMFYVGLDEAEATGSEVQLDDDLAMTQAEVNTKCPVTKKEMTRPVRNKHCGHVYDYDGARELIKNRHQPR